jgi:N-hydroxyarylamine O-acetyltransferase
MTASLDVDAYLGRIEWTGTARPTFHTLAVLVGAHMSRIPFENLDVLLGRPIRLDIDELQRKLVHQRRGGYCFEHVTLFAAVLEAIGFRPARHSARVTLITPRNASPRTHMFLTVPMAEGTFVLDPGFGALAPRIPVPLIDGERVSIDGETHLMARAGDDWILARSWIAGYRRSSAITLWTSKSVIVTHLRIPPRRSSTGSCCAR